MMRAEVGEFYYNFCIEKKKLIKILILKLINVQTFFILLSHSKQLVNMSWSLVIQTAGISWTMYPSI